MKIQVLNNSFKVNKFSFASQNPIQFRGSEQSSDSVEFSNLTKPKKVQQRLKSEFEYYTSEALKCELNINKCRLDIAALDKIIQEIDITDEEAKKLQAFQMYECMMLCRSCKKH